MSYQKYMILEEAGENGGKIFLYDVTEYLKEMMGTEIVREATVQLDYVEKFDKLKEKRQIEIREGMSKLAKAIDENYEKHKEIERYECHGLWVTLTNGKEICFNSIGPYWHLSEE